jgi:hypothetical protein
VLVLVGVELAVMVGVEVMTGVLEGVAVEELV